MESYMQTQPNPSFFTQFGGIIIRRYLVFKSEPRQWFMLVAPFISVISQIIVIQAFVLALTNNASGT
jgi:hypothetical protein